MKTFSTREEVLQDTINYYWGRPERKCVQFGMCKYIPIGESEGCAVGRLVSTEIAEELNEDGRSISFDKQFNLLPEWMKEMGQTFWIALQEMHDKGHLTQSRLDGIGDIIFAMKEIDISKITFPVVERSSNI